MTEITPRELLDGITQVRPAGPTLGIEADIPLAGKTLATVVKLLVADKSLVGLEVLTQEGKSLGIVPRSTVRQIADEGGTRGGSTGTLEGTVVLDAPLYRCDEHVPAYQRLSSLGPVPACRVCGKTMKRV
jgi:hypothetical protein